MYRFSAAGRRALAAAAAMALLTSSSLAAEPIGDGVAPVYDEAYYATLDYYGNLKEGSVVKSYVLNEQPDRRHEADAAGRHRYLPLW